MWRANILTLQSYGELAHHIGDVGRIRHPERGILKAEVVKTSIIGLQKE